MTDVVVHELFAVDIGALRFSGQTDGVDHFIFELNVCEFIRQLCWVGTVQYSTVQYSTVQYNTVQYILFYSILFYSILFYSILFYSILLFIFRFFVSRV